MRRPTRREAVLAAAFATLITLLVIWLPGRDPSSRSTDGTSTKGSGSGSVHAPSSFTISGDASGTMAPGAMVPLDLSLDNPNDFDLAIHRITVTVRDVDAPRADTDHPCSVADFQVQQLSGDVVPRLAAHGADRLSGMGVIRGDWPAVGMVNRPVNQDGCKGAVLTFGYKASGVEVRR